MKMRPRLKSLIHYTKLVQSLALLSWRYCCFTFNIFHASIFVLYPKSWHFICNIWFYMDSWQCTRLVDYYVPLFFTKIASLSPEEFCASASFCGGVTFIRLPRHEDTCTLCHEVVDEVVTNLEDPGMEVFACYTIIISFYATQFLYGLCLFFMLCSLIVMIQVTFSLNFW